MQFSSPPGSRLAWVSTVTFAFQESPLSWQHTDLVRRRSAVVETGVAVPCDCNLVVGDVESHVQ